jgi:drug/metabolite transporter, DME family
LARDAWVGVAQTALTAVMWGTSFPAVALGLEGGVAPAAFLLFRFWLAAPLMALAGVVMRKSYFSLLRRKEVWYLAVLNAFGFYCQFFGQQYTDASVAALLVNLSLIMAAAGGALLFRERTGVLRAGGFAAAFAGTVLVTTGGDLTSIGGGALLGDALYLSAALSWALYIIYSKKSTDALAWEPFKAAAAIVTATAAIVVVPALVAGLPGELSVLSWEAVAYTAVFNTALPYVLYQAGLGRLSAGAFSVVLMLEIVTGVFVSVAFLAERLTPLAWAGAALILASIALVSGLEAGGKTLSVAREQGNFSG